MSNASKREGCSTCCTAAGHGRSSLVGFQTESPRPARCRTLHPCPEASWPLVSGGLNALRERTHQRQADPALARCQPTARFSTKWHRFPTASGASSQVGLTSKNASEKNFCRCNLSSCLFLWKFFSRHSRTPLLRDRPRYFENPAGTDTQTGLLLNRVLHSWENPAQTSSPQWVMQSANKI
jgi:hypothetical protein